MVAIFPDDSGNISRLVPITPEVIDWSNFGEYHNTYEHMEWLDYNDVKQYISLNPQINDPNQIAGSGGTSIEAQQLGNSRLIWSLSAIFIGLCLLIIVIYLHKRKT